MVSKVTLTDGSSDYNKQNSRAFRAANSADTVSHTFAGTGEYEFQVTNGSKAMTFHANGTIILNDGLKVLTPTDGRVAAVSGVQDIVDTTNNPDQPHVLIGQPAPTHALTVNCGNPGEGVCTPATGIYDENHHMVFTATANAGYVIDTFEYVGMGVSDTDSGSPSLTSDIDFDHDITINITFKVKDANTTYKVTTRALPDNGTGGTVVVNKENALVGDNITVTTTPKPGKKLSSLVWYKSDEPETKHDILATKTFAMPESAVWVVATFEDDTTPPTTYAVTFNCGPNGTCTKNPNTPTHEAGSNVDITIQPDAGYTIESAKINDTVICAGLNSCTKSQAINENWVVNATFKLNPDSVKSVEVVTPPTKTTYTAGEQLDLNGLVVKLTKNDNSSEEVAFADFAANNLTATPANGTELNTTHTYVSIFHTTSSLSTSQSITVSPAPVTVTGIAVKTAPTKTTYTAGENLDLAGLVVTLAKSDSTTEDVVFANFAAKGLTANPANGAALTTATNSVVITHTASGKTATQAITVNPAPITRTLTLNCGAGGTCDKNPNQTNFDDGSSVMLEFEAGSGYLIDSITVNGVAEATAVDQSAWSLNLTMDGDKTVVATFKLDTATYTSSLNCGANGTCNQVPAGNTHPAGTSLNINIQANADYLIESITINGVPRDTGCNNLPSCNIAHIMDSNKTIVIAFKPIIVPRTLTINCGAGGACTPDKTNYVDGDTATVTLAPDTGKQVKSVAGATKVNDTTYTVLMDADKTVTVEFEDVVLPPLTPALSTDKVTVKQNEDLVIKLENASEHNGKTVVFWLNSDPVKLGEAIVTDGKVAFTAKVPCGVKPGDHTITATIDGNPVGAAVAVTVLSSPTCPTTGTPATGIGGQALTTLVAALTLVATGFGINKKFAKKF